MDGPPQCRRLKGYDPGSKVAVLVSPAAREDASAVFADCWVGDGFWPV